jgi:hypothetical protein
MEAIAEDHNRTFALTSAHRVVMWRPMCGFSPDSAMANHMMKEGSMLLFENTCVEHQVKAVSFDLQGNSVKQAIV